MTRSLLVVLLALAGCGGTELPKKFGPAEWHVDAATGWMICNSPELSDFYALPDGQRQGFCTWHCVEYEGVAGRSVVLTFWRGAQPTTAWDVQVQYITPAGQAPDVLYGCTAGPNP
jgi:hypothetical protein